MSKIKIIKYRFILLTQKSAKHTCVSHDVYRDTDSHIKTRYSQEHTHKRADTV